MFSVPVLAWLETRTVFEFQFQLATVTVFSSSTGIGTWNCFPIPENLEWLFLVYVQADKFSFLNPISTYGYQVGNKHRGINTVMNKYVSTCIPVCHFKTLML